MERILKKKAEKIKRWKYIDDRLFLYVMGNCIK